MKNEKYKGDALLQKSFTVDFLTKTKKINEGEVPQYYVKNSHPAIIEPLEFDMVQAEIARRKRIGNYYSGNSVFSSRLVCGDCGSFYGQKVWHSNDAYRRTIWQCNGKFKNKNKCTTSHLSPGQIQQAFLKAYNIMMSDRETVIADCEIMRSETCDYTQIETEIVKQKDEVDITADFIRKCIQENATSAQSQEEYAKRYENLVKRYEKAKKKYDALVAEKLQRIEQGKQLRIFIDELKNQPLLLDTWDERLWTSLVEKGTVNADGSIEFEFKNNKRIMVES